MKIIIDLTENESRALNNALFSAHRLCFGSCVYPEEQTKKTTCDGCPYTKAIKSLRRKFEKPKTLDKHDEQVKKEVRKSICGEIKKRSSKQYGGYAFNLGDDVYIYSVCDFVLDDIEKGERDGNKN